MSVPTTTPVSKVIPASNHFFKFSCVFLLSAAASFPKISAKRSCAHTQNSLEWDYINQYILWKHDHIYKRVIINMNGHFKKKSELLEINNYHSPISSTMKVTFKHCNKYCHKLFIGGKNDHAQPSNNCHAHFSQPLNSFRTPRPHPLKPSNNPTLPVTSVYALCSYHDHQGARFTMPVSKTSPTSFLSRIL